MKKVVKFGGSSLASAEQFMKVGAIIRADESRRYVVPSAPGKRFSDDTKVTDMLYACYDLVEKDEDFRVILDANPAAKGHALILPKEHYANLYEIDDELAGKSMILAKKMITKLTKALGCDGYNIVQNNGEAAGQTVFHYHVHMIPRHKDDKVGLGWTMHELTEEEKEDVLSKIK